MLKERRYGRTSALLGSLILFGGLAQASVLYTGTISLANTDPTQLGRLSRDAIFPDWSFQKNFPGVINPTVSYHRQHQPGHTSIGVRLFLQSESDCRKPGFGHQLPGRSRWQRRSV